MGMPAASIAAGRAEELDARDGPQPKRWQCVILPLRRTAPHSRAADLHEKPTTPRYLRELVFIDTSRSDKDGATNPTPTAEQQAGPELRQLSGAKAPEQSMGEETPQTSTPAVAPEAKPQTAPPPEAPNAAAPEAKPQTLPPPPPPPPPDGFSGICKAGGKSAPPAKGTAPAAPKPAAMQQEQSGQRSLKQVYFDFDQTISKIHVFKQLAAWESGVEAPHALDCHCNAERLVMDWMRIVCVRTSADSPAGRLLCKPAGSGHAAEHHHEGQRGGLPLPLGAGGAAVLRAGLRDAGSVLRRVRLRPRQSGVIATGRQLGLRVA